MLKRFGAVIERFHAEGEHDPAHYPELAELGAWRQIADNPACAVWSVGDAGAEAGARGRVLRGLEARIAADPAAATCRWHIVTLRIVRR